MQNRFYNKLSQFRDSESGSVVLIVVFVLLAILLSVGAAIDMSRIQSAKAKLSACADTAGLAAVAKMGDVPSDKTVKQWVTDNVNKYFSVNCRFGYEDTTAVAITKFDLQDNNVLTLEVQTTIPTRLMKVIGINTVTITSQSIVKRSSDNGIEVVLVLDNTGSMGLQVDSKQPSSAKKIDALKSAANTLVKKLSLGNTTLTSNAWVGIVPFAQAVNIGGTNTPNNAWNSNWVAFKDGPGQEDFGPTFGANKTCDPINGITAKTTPADYTAKPPTPAHCSYTGTGISLNSTSGHTHWYGCVKERLSPDDISDLNPGSKKFSTYYASSQTPADVMVLYPYSKYPGVYLGGPSDMNYVNKLANNWRSTTLPLTYVTPLWNIMNPPTPDELLPLGPNAFCPAAITPMTHDTGELANGINAMTPNGQTVIPNALAWGWRMLSPNWQGYWGGEMGTAGLPMSYDTPNHEKAIVFMTDGNNYFFPGSYTAYGRLADKTLGTDVEADAVTELDKRTKRVCKNIKAAGITIYTIGFGSSDGINAPATNGPIPEVNGALLQYCASNKNLYFFAPTNEKLADAFVKIANSLLNPRVAQ